jgi:outer membrane protein OmpA-like peptidoglycan-associated protein/Tol biopolymer transport system component
MCTSLPPIRYATLAILLFSTCLLHAQADKGLKMLNKGQFEQAMTEFRKVPADPEETVIALYGMASVYRDTAYGGFQIDTAYYYAESAHAAYRKLSSKEKERLDGDLDPKVSALKNQVIGQALKAAEKLNTLEAYDHFLTVYSKAPESRLGRAREKWNTQLTQRLNAATTWQDFSSLYSRFGTTIAAQNPQEAVQIEQKLFNLYLAENGLDQFPQFARQFPQHPYVKDNIQTRFETVKQTGDPAAYDKFIAAYPASNPFVPPAIDGLCETVIKKGELKACENFLKKYPKHPRKNEVWLAYYEAYKQQNNFEKAAIERFKAQYQAFPYPDMVQADIKASTDLLYANTMKKGTQTQAIDFIKQYPDYPRLDSMWLRYYTLYKAEKGDLTGLERFGQTHPNFPHKAIFNKDKAKALDAHVEKVLAGKDVSLYRSLVENYSNYTNINKVWRGYFQLLTAQAEDAAELESFKQRYPKFPFPKELDAAIAAQKKIDLEKAYKTLDESSTTTDYLDFVKAFPTSPYRSEIEKSLSTRLTASGNAEEIGRFLEVFPKSTYRPALLKRLYPLATADGSLNSIMAFENAYPDFPDKAKIADDKKLAGFDIDKYSPELKPAFVSFIKTNAPREIACQALRKILASDMRANEWDKAYQEALTFQDAFGEDSECYNQLLASLAPPDGSIKPESVGATINSAGSESAPVFTVDGSTLFFCGKQREGSMGGEDIFVSTKTADGWTTPVLVENLNTIGGHEAPEGISADGNQMLLFSSGNLCISEKTTSGWSKPQALPSTINRLRWQADARITADGKAIIFASGASNSSGVDIYVSLLQPDGAWGPAQSLGPVINTAGVDRSPFLHPDMKTLYFSSDRPGGLGSLDIYLTKRLDNGWTNWSTPINLGRNINTNEHDYDFRVSTDGTTAYYTVYEGSTASGDIYLMPMPKAYKPQKVKTITGKLLDIDQRPIDAPLVWINLDSGDTIQITRPDPITGQFVATVPDKVKVGYYVAKDNYMPIAGYIDPTKETNAISVDKPMVLMTPEQMKENNVALPLNNLFFETAKFEIKPESYPELDRLVQWVQQYNLKINILGHTDNVGADQRNQSLSDNRANAVRDYLVSKGCPADHISAQGFGESQPVSTNDTDEGRAQNRRVEIKIAQ